MLDKSQSHNVRSYSLIALSVFALSLFFSSLIFRFTEGKPYFLFVVLISIKTLVLWWLIPLLIIYKLEKRDLRSLGLWIPREKYLLYAVYAITALILPVFFVGYDSYYPLEFLEQILYIGFAEEVFYRGYVMTRICQWLGKYRGLLVTSLCFGLGHVISRVADQGVAYLLPAMNVGLQTFFGGLIFGIIYLRAKNIWPSVILHISTNMYLMDLVARFQS